MSSDDIDLSVVMNWMSDSFVGCTGEPDDLIYETSGDLVSIDDEDKRELVGKFRLFYVDVERADDEGIAIWAVLDAHSAATAEYYEPLFDGEGFSDRILDLIDHEVAGRNVLILDRLEILPKYRGRKLGLEVMRHMIRRFSSGTGIVAIKPFPLQGEVIPTSEETKKWRADLALDQLPTDQIVATTKLREYYSQIGFVSLDATPFMVRATAWQLSGQCGD